MLYLERKRAAQDSAKEHGFEVTPEDSFFAIIRILSGSGDAKFYDKANELYERYIQCVDDEERAAVIEEAGVVIHEYRVAVYGEELVRTLSTRSANTNLGEFVHAEGVFSEYGYKITPEDVKLLQEMIKEIRAMADQFRKSYDAYLNGESCKFGDVFRMFPTPIVSADFDKLAIAYVIDEHRVPWEILLSPVNAFLAYIKGGCRNFSYFKGGVVFCADLAVVCKILADEVGYLGDIKSVFADHKKSIHQYVRFEDGSVYDPFGSYATFGYRKDNPYKEYAK